MKKIYFLLFAFSLFVTVNAQIVDIPDAKFKLILLSASSTNDIAQNLSGNNIKIDINNNNEIEISEVLAVAKLKLYSHGITDLIGISSFTNLKSLNCGYNQLTSLDVTPLVNLSSLECFGNKLISLDVTPLVNLSYLDCSFNKLTSLDVTTLGSLSKLVCMFNQLTSLDVAPLVNLTYLDCSSNLITSLDLSNNIHIKDLYCTNNRVSSLNINNCVELVNLSASRNELISLDVSDNINLDYFSCGYNKLTTLDFSTNIGYMNDKAFGSLLVNNNQLKSIILPNFNANFPAIKLSNNLFETIEFKSVDLSNMVCNANPNLTSIIFKNLQLNLLEINFNNAFFECPNLKYLCVKESDILIATEKFSSFRNLQINSYCSFNPGGIFYIIKGNTKVDNNNNGCDVEDTNYPNFKFNITNSTISGSLISDASGNYSIPVQAGTHTMTPVLENPSYFNISPTNTVVTFPTQTSPFTQDFCITTNGVHPDLEVTVLPINRARPRFDASYKIIYKNKGTNTQSGSVNLKFNDAVLDLVSSTPVVATQTANNLSWDFSDLKPFETREITVTVNVNGPMETPAVNGGDTLDFTTTITSTLTDETPTDNTFTLNQTVVNAFDPNDKTCLEGTTIPPSAVGKYVHYMIRFENKGTAEAQNVVVKDMIDTSKFDISSLLVTQGSHPFVTKISETNKVEFIFENINLPFDDATNDGYVAFKIKTKPSLVVGDSFSNTASIYFDYNFPIVTNTATTSVLQSLGNQDFKFDSYFRIYPNPVKEVLNIDFKKQIEVTSISIFNMLGQQILVIPNAQQTKQVDVSSLKTGNYFIKLSSNIGNSNARFIKS